VTDEESAVALDAAIGDLMCAADGCGKDLVSGIGDVNSDEPGSGARYNDGKDPLDLVPCRHWLLLFKNPNNRLILNWLIKIQESPRPLTDEIMAGPTLFTNDLVSASKVFEYGAKKYAAWNWAKGMDWSVPIGCAIRHMLAIEAHGLGALDDESNQTHWGHVVCNVIMLMWFIDLYPEGDNVALPLCQRA
jgi:hypothetical protein